MVSMFLVRRRETDDGAAFKSHRARWKSALCRSHLGRQRNLTTWHVTVSAQAATAGVGSLDLLADAPTTIGNCAARTQRQERTPNLPNTAGVTTPIPCLPPKPDISRK
jgi:hypothetical protein